MLQFWTPEFLQGFGVGAVNGSLWSISVEIQFYIVTALMYAGIRRLSPMQQTVVIGLLAVFFSIFNGQREAAEVIIERSTGNWILMKLYGVSFIPWFFMFLCGALAQRMSSWIVPLCIECAPTILVMYVASMLIDFHFWGVRLGNDIPPYLVPIMGLAVLSVAYVRPTLGHQVLRGNDVSYGLYIYHMPIVNSLIELSRSGSVAWVAVAVGAATACAISPWRFVERPFLGRKRAALRQVAVSRG
jgi:peptidoglycan/LPS O-acetylase OafA/YrhL